MTVQHSGLAEGRWHSIGLLEQMAHIGGEVERAMLWQERGNPDYSRRAYERALELLDLTLDDHRRRSSVRELARLREALADWFDGSNEFGSSSVLWRSYFGVFALAARRNR